MGFTTLLAPHPALAFHENGEHATADLVGSGVTGRSMIRCGPSLAGRFDSCAETLSTTGLTPGMTYSYSITDRSGTVTPICSLTASASVDGCTGNVPINLDDFTGTASVTDPQGNVVATGMYLPNNNN